ncbi:asparaginase [Limibaculum sp. M0105]|uniref:Asparaginase n=1 Tax=Thermohalobaculum xanthum TaxID=2753746 RepID=A0A8J7M9T1_9RHOB|nr:asparaginase [Thermohalobaculum xanthum]MBK0400338.1 asparaginase [Thermohalobaculum xanthum]
MEASPVLAEVWRGPVLESVHRGAVAICRPDGELVEAWGEPGRVILPRSSCKMIQALPLVESGAADRYGLTAEHLALACASHQGATIHTALARDWLATLGLGDGDLRCGAHAPYDTAARRALRNRGEHPCQVHNNCSGKHCGFLTVNAHLGGDAEYVDPDHPVQRAVRAATEEVCDETVTAFAIDGCSAPNFAVTLKGLATAMARFARPAEGFRGIRAQAATRLRDAMAAHPELVAGEGRACTALMRAMNNGTVVKTGAEAVFVGILPEQGLGIALKIDDGATRGSEAAIAALLVRHGALDAHSPAFRAYADHPIENRRHIVHGHLRAAETLFD